MHDSIAALGKMILETRAGTVQMLNEMREEIKKETEAKMNQVLDTLLEATAKGRPETNARAQMLPAGNTLTRGAPANLPGSILPPWVGEIRQLLQDFGILGGGGGDDFGLDGEFKTLAEMFRREALLKLKNDYRARLGLPVIPSHVQESAHQ